MMMTSHYQLYNIIEVLNCILKYTSIIVQIYLYINIYIHREMHMRYIHGI